MFLEIFARTFVWIVYIMLSSVFLRLFGIYKKVSESLFIFKDYPELLYILLGLLFLVMNYFSVKEIYHLGCVIYENKIKAYRKNRHVSRNVKQKRQRFAPNN